MTSRQSSSGRGHQQWEAQAVHVPRLRMEINADRVAHAGTGRSRTYNTMNTKNPLGIDIIYQDLRNLSRKQQAASGKRQATSVKRCTERQATSAECDPNHQAPSSVQRQAASRESRTKDTA